MAQAQQSLDQAKLEYQKYQGYQAKQIATASEVTARKQKVDELEVQIKGLKDQKAALVSPTDRASAEARLKDAQSALKLADVKVESKRGARAHRRRSYQFDLKRGSYLNAGDTVAMIGRLDRVNVRVYVDERDLGRVMKGMPVRITWDALAGREWKGVVNKLPTQVVALGSRQVGEVVCLIDNPSASSSLEATSTWRSGRNRSTTPSPFPKRRCATKRGRRACMSLRGDTIHWQPVGLGIDNTTRTQVTSGLNDGDAIALLSEKPLKDGMPVLPVFP